LLSRLTVQNFKSIGKNGIKLGLKPLTILIGENGSGKSSILEAISLFAQSIGGSGFALEGGLVSFPSFAFVAHKGETQRRIFISVVLNDDCYGYAYTPDTGAGAQGFSRMLGDREQVLFMLSLSLTGNVREGFKCYLQLDSDNETVVPGNSLLPFLSAPPIDLLPGKQAELKEAALVAERLAGALRNKVFPVFALRGGIPIHTEVFGGPPVWVSTGDRLLQILGVLKNPLYDRVQAPIEKWAQEFGLSRVGAAPGSLGHLQGYYVDPVFNVPLNLAVASHGAKQALTMITQLFWAPPASVILIEEPELSLHPAAQVELGEMFAEAIQEGKQIIASTHSHFLLLALSRAVEKGLKVEDIAVYHVTKGKEGTEAKTVKLSKRGYPLGWPPSYKKVELEIARKWAQDLAE